MATTERDAFGQMMRDHLAGCECVEIVERDDGYIGTSGGPAAYFSEPEAWRPAERDGLRAVRGRVLDVGCGAGRHSLHLQDRGHEVVAIDNSPGAIEVARSRGVRRAILLDLVRASRKRLGRFDTILLLGNNFALLGTPRRARWMLRRFRSMTGPDGRIVAQNRDPHATDDPDHLAYHERNRRRGRMAGEARIRIRYRRVTSAWFDFLLLSPEELESLLEGTGWARARLLPGDAGIYYVVLEKT